MRFIDTTWPDELDASGPVIDLSAVGETTKSPQVAANLRGDRLAYVVYTSGSTGQANGVAVEHRNLAPLARWHIATYRPDGKATSWLAGLAFDASVWELWP